MKKKILTFLIIAIFGGFTPSFSADDTYTSIEEYEKLFEMGLVDDEESVDTEEEIIIKPKPKEKMKYDDKNVIKPDIEPLQLKTGKAKNIDVYKETYKKESGKNEYIKSGKLTIYSENTKEMNSYMKNDLKSTMNASYKVNKNLDLRAGQEVWYVNSDANLGARKLYVNPRLNVSDNMYFDYAGKYNETNKNLEQEVGVNIKPKIFKGGASFGVKAGATTNEEGETQSQKLKFTTDFYLF